MRTLLLTITLLGAAAPGPAQNAPLAPFPADYKPSACATGTFCQSFERGRITSAGRTFLGYSIEHEWLVRYWDEMMAIFKPICAKAGTCYAIHGSTFQWCNDLLMPEFRSTCNRFEKGSPDWTQCTMFVDIWALGRDQHTLQWWKDAQACIAKSEPFVPSTRPPVVWMDPPVIAPGYKDYIRIYAVDPETHRPVPGRVTVEKQTIYASSNPTGILWTYYPWKWPWKFNREPNAAGHRDLVAPMVTVAPEGYPPVTFRLPVEVPKMIVTMSPATLKTGKNTVIVTAHDAATNEPVELRVMYGDQIVGESNKPFTLELKRGQKRRELWATNLFERYSDVVIAPAGK